MTERRMNKLLCELNLPENSVYIPDTDKILKGVKSKIEKTEKRNVWGLSFSKAVALAVIVVLMLAFTTVAFGKDGVIRKIITIIEQTITQEVPTEATEPKREPEVVIEETMVPTEVETVPEVNPNYKSPIFDKYHKEDSEKAEEYLLNVYDSVEDDNYIFSVNEVVGDSTNLYLTVTVEAKNQESLKKLTANAFNWIKIEAYSNGEWKNVGGGTGELENLRRENSRSFSIHCFGDAENLGTGYTKIRATCREFSSDMQGERYVYFELEDKKEEIEFEFLGQSFSGGKIKITPMGIAVHTVPDETYAYAPDARNLDIFFKFKQGLVKTFNQVAGFDTTMNLVSGDLRRFEVGTKSVIDIENLESVIVKGIEYPVDNPENYSAVTVDAKLKPFILYNIGLRNGDYYYVCNLRQLEGCIDIVYDENGVVEFNYSGKSYRVEAGNFNVLINGKTNYDLRITPYMDDGGNVWVGMDFMNYMLGIRYQEIGLTGAYLFVP